MSSKVISDLRSLLLIHTPYFIIFTVDMGLLDTLLGRSKNEEVSSQSVFGRYSDSQKSDVKYDRWDRALKAYEEGMYLENFTHLLEFLKDDSLNNLSYSEHRGVITFQFYQGSKLIVGVADRNKLRAEAKIAVTSKLELGFTRTLIEQNFGLQYCRFALCKNDDICILFDTYAVDASPYKVYYALKELASKADKYDDILLAEYTSLSKIGDHHISKVPQPIKDIKYRYIQNRISSLLEIVNGEKLNVQEYPAGLCYLILDIAYKIDYLVKPEGYTMDVVEEIHQTYFQSKSDDIHAKNQRIIQKLKTWLQRPREYFDNEIYEVISTFGITMPSGHDKLAECIQGELPNMDWYYDNKYDDVALAIPSYLVGYLMFSYALPDPDRDFLHILYEIVESDFFAEMGYPNKYWKKDKLNASVIRKRISRISESHAEKYPKLKPDLDSLDFSDVCLFSKSYMKMLSELDMFTKDLRS